MISACGRPNQLSPHRQAYNLTQRKVQALSMAKWRFFRSGNNRLRFSQSPAETSGSIVMVAVETTSARISTCAVKFPTGRASGFATCHRGLTGINLSRTPVCLKSDSNRLEAWTRPERF